MDRGVVMAVLTSPTTEEIRSGNVVSVLIPTWKRSKTKLKTRGHHGEKDILVSAEMEMKPSLIKYKKMTFFLCIVSRRLATLT